MEIYPRFLFSYRLIVVFTILTIAIKPPLRIKTITSPMNTALLSSAGIENGRNRNSYHKNVKQ